MTKYVKLFSEELGKLAALYEQREQLDDEIHKHRAAASALFSLMNETEQQACHGAIEEVNSLHKTSRMR